MKIIIQYTVLFLMAGCHTTAWRSVFRPHDFGVAPVSFQSKDGDYFPTKLKEAFPRARDFEASNSKIANARSGVRLIEVRPLNKGLTRRHEANLAWSIDGMYLSYEINKFYKRLINVKSIDGSYNRELMVVPKRKDSFLDGLFDKSLHSINAGLSWSKDSNRYTFMSNGGNGDYNIYVGAVGVNEKVVAESPAKDGYAKWSPANNTIAFVSSRSGRGDIYEMNMDFKTLQRITFSEQSDLFPEWFGSGNRIVYVSGKARNHSIYYVERDRLTGQWNSPVRLTNWSYDDLRPIPSPDGQYVAFYTNSGLAAERGEMIWNIHVVPVDNAKTLYASDLRNTVVSKNVAVDLNTGPAWSPNSKSLFFVRKDRNKFNPISYVRIGKEGVFDVNTNTRMNRDLMISKLGVLSFRAQSGVWDKVYIALTNQGIQLQGG